MHKAKAFHRRVSRGIWISGWLTLVLLLVASSIRGTGSPQAPDDSRVERKTGDAALGSQHVGHGGSSVVPSANGKFEVTVRRPSGPPQIELKQSDPLGRVGKVTCSTCHAMRRPNLENRGPSDLKQFHQDMPLHHGTLACYSCHNPDDSDTLRLADGRVVEYADVMNLCGQCHGSQAGDYPHGGHGGMNGYWDLTRGARVRNNCIDCHDPHVPEFPRMQPKFKPRDRFLGPHDAHPQHHETVKGTVGHE